MILKNYKQSLLAASLLFVIYIFGFATCKYGFTDAEPLPVDIKTFRVQYIENKAQLVNNLLSPQLTDKIRQKISSTTRLKSVNNADADYEISGYISQYYVTTVGISDGRASTNRLNVSLHLQFKNRKNSKKDFEADLTRNIDFDGNRVLSQVENQITPQIVNNLADEVFNRIFSNW